MASWTYVIYPKSDFATLDFYNTAETNATLNPIYITVEDDDTRFNQNNDTSGQVITDSSDPSLVGQFIYSEVRGSRDVLYDDSSGSVLTINEVSIGGTTDYVLANLDGENTTLSPSTTYDETSIRSDTSWEHSGTELPCFTSGTLIRTPNGDTRIETLSVGDEVLTADNGAETIRWIGQRTIDRAAQLADPTLRPILIEKGAIGDGLPRVDLSVSRQHRMLVRSRIASRMFGTEEVLVPAIKLVGLPGISIDQRLVPVTYLHILCRRHEILYAHGCRTESLFLGPVIRDAAASEAMRLFADLPLDQFSHAPARTLVKGKRAARLAERHRANGRALVAAPPRCEVSA